MFGLMGKERDPFEGLEQLASHLLSKVSKPEFEMDVADLGDSFRMEADLPGLTKGDLKVDVAGTLLTITVTRQTDTLSHSEEERYIRRERFHGTARRIFDVSNVDTELITAQYDNGVLTLHLPKKESARTSVRRLEIQ